MSTLCPFRGKCLTSIVIYSVFCPFPYMCDRLHAEDSPPQQQQIYVCSNALQHITTTTPVTRRACAWAQQISTMSTHKNAVQHNDCVAQQCTHTSVSNKCSRTHTHTFKPHRLTSIQRSAAVATPAALCLAIGAWCLFPVSWRLVPGAWCLDPCFFYGADSGGSH